jgi:hypothetical protein
MIIACDRHVWFQFDSFAACFALQASVAWATISPFTELGETVPVADSALRICFSWAGRN